MMCRIEHISGKLTDHYDPRSKVLRSVGQHLWLQGLWLPSAWQLMSAAMRSRTRSSMVRWCSGVRWCLLANYWVHGCPGRYLFCGLIMSLRPLVMAGIVLFTLAVLFPAGDASRGVQRFRESHQSAGEHRHAGFHRDRRGEKSAAGSSHDLCGKPGSFCFTAFKTDYSGRRKKRP